jgi:hypothetical protein
MLYQKCYLTASMKPLHGRNLSRTIALLYDTSRCGFCGPQSTLNTSHVCVLRCNWRGLLEKILGCFRLLATATMLFAAGAER